MRRNRAVTPQRFLPIAWLALATQVGIVVTGAAVRLTQSGLGCTDWPGCTEDRLVPAWGFHRWVEFGNRLVTFAVVAAALLAALASRRRRPYRPGLQWLSWGLVVGVFAQALVGGVLVLLELDPRLTVLHFVLSVVLVADGVALVHGAGEDRVSAPGTPALPAAALQAPTPDPAWRLMRTLAWVLSAAVVVVMGTGTVVTGSGPHGGDARADRFGFALTAVTRVHTGALWIFVGCLLVTAVVVLRRGELTGHLRGRVVTLIALVGAQATLGYVQYALGVPAALVALHVAGSMAVFGVTVSFLLAVVAPTGRSLTPAEPGQDGRRAMSPDRPVLSAR
ncbi:MAG: COX15/CtaA family protein [Acidimicrobiales bacterium]